MSVSVKDEKSNVPPVGNLSTADRARAMAKRFRKQLDGLPPEWQAWVLGCVTFPTSDESK